MQGQRDIKRRNFLKRTVLVAVAVSVSGLKACKEDENTDPVRNDCATTKDILGPFYKAGAPYQENIIPPENKAAPLYIIGKVTGNCNILLKDATVEIWNANMEGAYDPSEAYKFRGQVKTETDGLYRFKTIIPGRYLNGGDYRPSHIHFRITAPGYNELVSQVYFKDDPFITQDPWAGDPSAAERILPIGKDEDGIDTVTFDIYLTS